MSDTITPDELAAIAAYRGSVYRAEPGETGLTFDCAGQHWKDQREQTWRIARRRMAFKNGAINAQIRALRAQGLSYAEIGRRIDKSQRAVWQRALRMGITGGGA